MSRQLLARLTLVLIGACVLLGLLALIFWLGVGRGFSWRSPDPSKAPKLPRVTAMQTEDFSLPDFASFAEITQRPLFSPDRQPIPADALAGDKAEAAAPPPVPLQVELTGVIITPHLKLAMLRNKATNQPVSLHEGMPLAGNQAGWTLVEISPRKVTFSNGVDKTDVTLDVSAKSGNPRSRAAPRRPTPRPASPTAKSGANAAAQALRARIEQRREELRKQAQKAREARNKSNHNQRAAWLPGKKSGQK